MDGRQYFMCLVRNLQRPAATLRPPRNHFIDVAALRQYYYKHPMNNPRSVN